MLIKDIAYWSAWGFGAYYLSCLAVVSYRIYISKTRTLESYFEE